MNKFYNVRNSAGRFTRRVARRGDGKFTSPNKIVAGCLYDWKGSTVRALKQNIEGLRCVSLHKSLVGFVPEFELKKINTRKVNNYLSESQ